MTRLTASRPIIAVLGPTASGKSAMAIDIARRYDGVIINCDSMQIYDGLRQITARPSPIEEMMAPHRLYGVMDPSERCSVKRWMDMAEAEIRRCWSENKLPVLTGGTGMYLNGLKDGLSAIPEIPQDIRDAVEARLTQYGPEYLHQELAREDPATAALLEPGDRQRLRRAMGLWLATGKGMQAWRAEAPVTGKLEANWQCFILSPDRELLYRRCNQRLGMMFEDGAIEEVAALKERNLDPTLPIMKAVGVPEILQYLDKQSSREQALEKARMMTRRYVKRQLTWFRGQMKDGIWLTGPQDDDNWLPAMIEQAFDHLKTVFPDLTTSPNTD